MSYPDYERRLQNLIAEEEQKSVRLQSRRELAVDDADSALTAYQEVLEGHRQDRDVVGVLGKIRSIATEPFLREETSAREAEEDLAEMQGRINDHDVLLAQLRAECASVTRWVDELYAATVEAGRRRIDLQLNASRDITWRNFHMRGMGEYLEADDRRRLSWGPDMPGGADFGYKWRSGAICEYALTRRSRTRIKVCDSRSS